ncbi:hypothetical protein MRB53_030879 [Persea americana]|uniref:Uncharacterized protein n=1 Tax=Persea americana TaxID=3435 RepID=A0ACC2KMH4_PERAE|nr:hypothetical protein MRB53_030879 [Persea americana]
MKSSSSPCNTVRRAHCPLPISSSVFDFFGTGCSSMHTKTIGIAATTTQVHMLKDRSKFTPNTIQTLGSSLYLPQLINPLKQDDFRRSDQVGRASTSPVSSRIVSEFAHDLQNPPNVRNQSQWTPFVSPHLLKIGDLL